MCLSLGHDFQVLSFICVCFMAVWPWLRTPDTCQSFVLHSFLRTHYYSSLPELALMASIRCLSIITDVCFHPAPAAPPQDHDAERDRREWWLAIHSLSMTGLAYYQTPPLWQQQTKDPKFTSTFICVSVLVVWPLIQHLHVQITPGGEVQHPVSSCSIHTPSFMESKLVAHNPSSGHVPPQQSGSYPAGACKYLLNPQSFVYAIQFSF